LGLEEATPADDLAMFDHHSFHLGRGILFS
jgi:hypothetical protein